MNIKDSFKKVFSFLFFVSIFIFTSHSAFAATYSGISNMATGNQGTNTNGQASSGALFVSYFVRLWNTLSLVGSLLVIFYFVMGALDWLTSAGDAGKLQGARNKMLNAFIGLLLIVTSYTLIGYINNIIFGTDFNVLHPTLIIQ